MNLIKIVDDYLQRIKSYMEINLKIIHSPFYHLNSSRKLSGLTSKI